MCYKEIYSQYSKLNEENESLQSLVMAAKDLSILKKKVFE